MLKVLVDPYLVWWVVTYGELGAGIGLIIGGILNTDKLYPWIGDMLHVFQVLQFVV